MDIDSRQNSILKSPVIHHKLKSPAGNMLVWLATSRCSMAVLLVLYISPEGHNWGGLTVKSSFAEKKTEKAATINLFTLLPNL